MINIAILGIGLMGQSIAERLLKRRYPAEVQAFRRVLRRSLPKYKNLDYSAIFETINP